MCTKHRTQSHFAGMAGYSIGRFNIYLPGHMFALTFTLVLVRCAASKIARSKPKIIKHNEALE